MPQNCTGIKLNDYIIEWRILYHMLKESQQKFAIVFQNQTRRACKAGKYSRRGRFRPRIRSCKFCKPRLFWRLLRVRVLMRVLA